MRVTASQRRGAAAVAERVTIKQAAPIQPPLSAHRRWTACGSRRRCSRQWPGRRRRLQGQKGCQCGVRRGGSQGDRCGVGRRFSKMHTSHAAPKTHMPGAHAAWCLHTEGGGQKKKKEGGVRGRQGQGCRSGGGAMFTIKMPPTQPPPLPAHQRWTAAGSRKRCSRRWPGRRRRSLQGP